MPDGKCEGQQRCAPHDESWPAARLRRPEADRWRRAGALTGRFPSTELAKGSFVCSHVLIFGEVFAKTGRSQGSAREWARACLVLCSYVTGKSSE
eukprot:scaffold3323_cov279-Pinguiococcus_pyrenoidosus.AAC.20